jgi:DeoR/GlpR family transcriptional regulator of sugar metabolism
MLNTHRREHILEKLTSDSKVSVTDIAAKLDVSDETVRRDLKDLEKEGLLRRVHGGAISVTPIRDAPINERVRKLAREKNIIAQLAVDLIADHSSIFLNIGSTVEALARQLGKFSDLKLYTNSLNVAQIANAFPGVTVFVTPGQLRSVETDLVGYDTVSYIQNYYFDTVFMGIAAVSLERGFMDYEEDEARIRQVLIKSSRNKVMLADSSKFGKAANICSASFREIDRLVSDRRPDEAFSAQFEADEMEVIHG